MGTNGSEMEDNYIPSDLNDASNIGDKLGWILAKMGEFGDLRKCKLDSIQKRAMMQYFVDFLWIISRKWEMMFTKDENVLLNLETNCTEGKVFLS